VSVENPGYESHKMNCGASDESEGLPVLRIEGRYYRGRIARYNPKTGYGFVETPEGKHIFFYADQVRLDGNKNRKSDIRCGMVVGYDVGWTDRGIRVCRMKLFDKDRSRHLRNKE
jgi:cold shock CspA family protein